MIIAIVGLGLIGGSFAMAVKEQHIASKLVGVDASKQNMEAALKLGLVNEVVSLEEAIEIADLIYVAIPVDATISVVEYLLNLISKNQIIVDAGSTKNALCEAVKNHPRRGRLVASHPMWGTEHSGPEAAVSGAFTGKACVICEREKSDVDALVKVETIYEKLGMHIIHMAAAIHDTHAAYISHIAHITSFALANTVLEKEKEEDTIFEMAGGGFESTVRLAKSSPGMWAPIFMQNRENVLDVLNEHIAQLKKFKACLEKENMGYLNELMQNANRIKRILN